MRTSVPSLSFMIVLPIALAFGASACATKKYVRNQVAPVDQRVSALGTKTSAQMAALSAKQHADVSRLDERITTTDNKLAEVASSAQQANASAAQANQAAEANQAGIQNNNTAIAALGTLAQNAWNFQMIEKGDVTFAFNKATLDKDAKVALDLIAQKAKSMPRALVDLEGFTDKVGGSEYNLALSRRRAEAVARYLMRQNVPLQNIHIMGLGKEDPPPALAADFQAVEPNASPAEMRRLSRRVYIRVYAPATSIAGEAARSQP